MFFISFLEALLGAKYFRNSFKTELCVV